MAGRLQGKVAVVTGGCSGIGLATVQRFVEEGARVVIGDIDADRGHVVVGQLGGEELATFVPVDVTDKEQVDALFATAKETYGSVDIAFNNAGIAPPDDNSILDTDLEAWRRVQEVNLTSVYLCCKAALPHMLEQRSGSIINTASFVAVMGAATSQISYSASKGGVLSMSRELGVQFARDGIRVNALCPGPVNTPLLQELFATDPERAARRLVHVPMGRFAEPTELANAVLFLASDESSFITASSFLVDGGISAAYVTPSDRAVTVLIGVTTYREEAAWGVWRQRADVLQVEYADAVVRAGGVPLLLPPASADLDDARSVVAAIAGLVVTGGADVEPARYGEQPHERTASWRPDRDAWELALLRAAEEIGLPTLGVCRGMQLMAVAAGGTLDQHTPDVVGHEQHSPGGDAFGRRTVSAEPDTLIARIHGPEVEAHCHHHQSVATHPHFIASARAEDGTVEAIEQQGDRFCLGVQWHPEMSRDQRLFNALIEAGLPQTVLRDRHR